MMVNGGGGGNEELKKVFVWKQWGLVCVYDVHGCECI